MTKADLIDLVQKTRGTDLTKKQVTEIIDGVFKEIGDYFIKARVTKNATPKLTYPGFGTFTKKKRNRRKGRNPQTGAEMVIPASTSVTFSPGSEMKRRLNKK